MEKVQDEQVKSLDDAKQLCPKKCKGNYDKALQSVQAKNKQAVENVSDINTLKLKAKIEQQLATLERAMCEYAELLPELRRQEVLDIGSRNLESTDELRQWQNLCKLVL